MSELRASVVIGFKDWGIDRLQRCLASIHHSFDATNHEIIVSDYGSLDGKSVAKAASEGNARYIRTETDGPWSRARALNAGFYSARGVQLFATDADMIFAPNTLAAVSQRLHEYPEEAVILQCRDLPPELSIGKIDHIDWIELERIATVRPRWGMGGLVATHRDIFARLRGYDERMHTYGGEDMDYAARLRRTGVPINWLEDPPVRMYHTWHPSSRLAAFLDDESESAISYNRDIHGKDGTPCRNRINQAELPAWAPPLVSVIANIDANYDSLAEELNTVLHQTISDLEILLVDTGGVATSVAQRLDDKRLRVVRTSNRPWWTALHEATGTYSILHGPGTWHDAKRIEQLLDHTGEPHQMPADQILSALRTKQPELAIGHKEKDGLQHAAWSSLLMPTHTVQSVLHTLDLNITDPNDLVYALQRNGLLVTQVPEQLCVLTTGHDAQGELERAEYARSARYLSRRLGANGLPRGWLHTRPRPRQIESALNTVQTLMNGRVDATIWGSDSKTLQALTASLPQDLPQTTLKATNQSGSVTFRMVSTTGLKRSAARALRHASQNPLAKSSPHIQVGDTTCTGVLPAATLLLEHVRSRSKSGPLPDFWLIAFGEDQSEVEKATRDIQNLQEVTNILCGQHEEPDGTITYLVVGQLTLAAEAMTTLLSTRAEVDASLDVTLWIGQTQPDVTLADLIESST